MKQPRGFLVTVLNYNEYQDMKNYEKTNEDSYDKTKRRPRLNPTSPSINKNDKNEKNVKNDQLGEEIRKEILKHLGRDEIEIGNPTAYLSKIERECTPEAIRRAWKEWKRGNGINTAAQFFERCKYYTEK
jgi:hypothetical protein